MTTHEHDDLAREATAAGLTVARLASHRCAIKDGTEYAIQLWAADGVLWAEGTHESAGMVREHIRRYLVGGVRSPLPVLDGGERDG